MPALPLSPLSVILRDALAPALALASAVGSIPEPPAGSRREGATSACPGFGPYGGTCERRPDGVCEPCGLPEPALGQQIAGWLAARWPLHTGRRLTYAITRRPCRHEHRDSDGQCGQCGHRAQLPPVLASWHGEHPQPNDPPSPILARVAGTLATLAHRERDAARTYRARGDGAMLACPPDSDAARLFWQLAHAAECRAFALDHAHAVVTLAPDHPGDDFDQLAMRAALLAVEHPSS